HSIQIGGALTGDEYAAVLCHEICHAVSHLDGDISPTSAVHLIEHLAHGAAETVCAVFGLDYARNLSLVSGYEYYAPWSDLTPQARQIAQRIADELLAHLAVLPSAAQGKDWGYLKALWPAVP